MVCQGFNCPTTLIASRFVVYCILLSNLYFQYLLIINGAWTYFWWCFTCDRAPNLHCLPLLLMFSLSYGCQSCFPWWSSNSLEALLGSLNHFSSFSPRSDLSLFMGSPRLQVQFHIKVALTALFLIGWDEGVMTMQVGEVARIQVYSWDVKLAWLPECVCFTLPACISSVLQLWNAVIHGSFLSWWK